MCDVTDEGAVNHMISRIEAEVGVVDILVNNAGIIKRIPMCDMTAEQFRQVFDVDLNAPFIVSKTPAGRWGEAEDLGGLAVFLASDFVNGHVLYVDVGILAYIGKQPQ